MLKTVSDQNIKTSNHYCDPDFSDWAQDKKKWEGKRPGRETL